MSDAPERIATWCWNGKTNAGQWSNNLTDHCAPTVEYVRADLVAALEAENQRLREALEQIAIQKRTDELATVFDVEFAEFVRRVANTSGPNKAMIGMRKEYVAIKKARAALNKDANQ